MSVLHAVMLLAAVLAATVCALLVFILKQRTGAHGANALLYGGSAAVSVLALYFTALGAYR
ncbi:hypothetical protein ACPA54_13450 [Uniformispora flossi]|uniref:hypothetical protein n=1 Tax=Uniformispora flossi TaxID=3390723 RepID=UPI003C2DC955